MNANELADELKKMFVGEEYDRLVHEIPDLLRQQADLIRNLQKSLGFKNSGYETINLTPQLELTDEEWNKAFDCYCETDEGVLKFDFELRDEWKKEQLIRWKEALRKAQGEG